MKPDPWHIWIDTGGTFTDCVARDPNGRLHRAKVLSTGSLRAIVKGRLEATRLAIDQNWGACDDFVRGMQVRTLTGRPCGRTARSFDSTGSILELDGPVELEPGTLLELVSGEEAPVMAARLVTRTPAGQPLPAMSMRLATTRATNALLERKGAKIALFITRGFGDLLLIGDQQRPDLFALTVRKPPPLHELAVEVDERLAADGTVIRPLDIAALEAGARRARDSGIEVAAVALMHSYKNQDHERQVAAVLKRLGFRHVSCSSDLAPLIRIVPRAQTAVVDAYLAPAIETYLQRVRSSLGGAPLHVMTSAGGLAASGAIRPKDAVLSGPAGGVAGAAAAGRRSGFEHTIGFDMGGTSTDVARFDGDFDYVFEHTVGCVRLMAPALAIQTVASGGGSICRFVDGLMSVGPDSAGAAPGPACYGSGGSLTLTDVNLLMGRLNPLQFEIPLFRRQAEAALDRIATEARRQTGRAISAEEMLEGFIAIADERMAEAIAQVSLKRGYDPGDYALVAFGGAGGQHACGVASRLGIRTVVMPEDASLLSAVGLGGAVIERFAQRQVLRPLAEMNVHLAAWFDGLTADAKRHVAAEGVESDQISTRRRIVNLRLAGQDHALALEYQDGCDLAAKFAGAYRAVYGHDPRTDVKPIEVESISVAASSRAPAESSPPPPAKAHDAVAARHARAWFGGRWIEAPIFDRAGLAPGARCSGPALVFDRRSACVIESGWSAEADTAGALVLRQSRSGSARSGGGHDIARAELFASRFMSIAQEMGQMLQRTALSTNVKERLDFSCTVLDADGELLANAPHMPVHLGSMGLCVRAVRDAIDMRDGDVIVTNHPAYGGSHLPDLTVITPVFDPKSGAPQSRPTRLGYPKVHSRGHPNRGQRDWGIRKSKLSPAAHLQAEGLDVGSRGVEVTGTSSRNATDTPGLIGYVASRAHHAEIGGTRPGSMPPTARTLMEEGVVIAPMRLIDGGRERFDELARLLRAGAHPSRAVADNLADVAAQVAANVRGAAALRGLAERYGAAIVAQEMDALKDRSERGARAAIARFPSGRYEALEHLDDGSPLRVRIDIDGDRATIDFTGTSPHPHPGNLNATPAIVRSAVIYVLRLLMGESLPLNEGIMRAVEVTIPPGMLNPSFPDDPARCPAVVGGNVETSQRLVDTLLKALRVAGCSQGTMNNTLFGTDRFGYYETVCGGSGATAEADGADAVHTHMTNTRLTDPEILEQRYPVRLDRFCIRRGSGGAGAQRGGDGTIREIGFLAPMSLSIVSQHRREGPYGMNGGEPGATGRQQIVHADGSILELGAIDGCELRAGDRLILQTPGGGGYGVSHGTDPNPNPNPHPHPHPDPDPNRSVIHH